MPLRHLRLIPNYNCSFHVLLFLTGASPEGMFHPVGSEALSVSGTAVGTVSGAGGLEGEVGEESCMPLYGHSLSWRDNNLGQPGPDHKLCAKVWMPQHPSHEDMANLASV